eukprot:362877-Chlamydomonas_euryale.AAC.5
MLLAVIAAGDELADPRAGDAAVWSKVAAGRHELSQSMLLSPRTVRICRTGSPPYTSAAQGDAR